MLKICLWIHRDIHTRYYYWRSTKYGSISIVMAKIYAQQHFSLSVRIALFFTWHCLIQKSVSVRFNSALHLKESFSVDFWYVLCWQFVQCCCSPPDQISERNHWMNIEYCRHYHFCYRKLQCHWYHNLLFCHAKLYRLNFLVPVFLYIKIHFLDSSNLCWDREQMNVNKHKETLWWTVHCYGHFINSQWNVVSKQLKQ